MAISKTKLKKQAGEIIKQAEKRGLTNNYFFVTTFQRYQMQMTILDELEKGIIEYGPTVEKEYVKGSKNICTNPAITEYNRTTTAANGTVATLLKILQSLPPEESGDALADFLNG